LPKFSKGKKFGKRKFGWGWGKVEEEGVEKWWD